MEGLLLFLLLRAMYTLELRLRGLRSYVSGPLELKNISTEEYYLHVIDVVDFLSSCACSVQISAALTVPVQIVVI